MPTLLIFLMPLLLGLCSLIYGLDCAVRVSQLIAFERKNNTFELLALCPSGALAVCWALCTSQLYQQQQFSRLREIFSTSTRIAFGIIAVLLGLIIIVSFFTIISAPKLVLPALIPLINVEALVTLLYTEYIQSTVIGCLVGLIISTFGISVLDSFLYAPAIFFLIKIASYVVSLFAGFYLLDMIYQQIGLQGGGIDILLTLLRVTVIVVIQDVIIRLLWRLAIKRTDTMPDDVDLALYPPRLR